jgi:hypothetical protein
MHATSPVAPGPDFAALKEAVTAYARYTRTDECWAVFCAATAPQPDLATPAHRLAALRWLNSAGCRIRYPRQGEPDIFDTEIARWWERWRHSMPAPQARLADLDDTEIATAGACYEELAGTAVAVTPVTRTLGPTAAAKLLHALRPGALMPWDAAIAQRLHGTRDAVGYASHQRLGRAWGRALLGAADTGEDQLSALLGRPGRPLAKMLDEYCYITFTLAGQDEPS